MIKQYLLYMSGNVMKDSVYQIQYDFDRKNAISGQSRMQNSTNGVKNSLHHH